MAVGFLRSALTVETPFRDAATALDAPRSSYGVGRLVKERFKVPNDLGGLLLG